MSIRDRRRRDLTILVILSALMSLASVSTDLYLPAMPTITREFQAAGGSIALTLSGFLVGFSLGQLIWGPVGDRYGRRLPIALGLILFIIGSAGCALSTSVMQMIFWRVIQALGACAGPVLARAMVRDLYARERSAQMLSTLILFMAVAPLLGPVLGGQIMAISSWHNIFWVMVAVGLVALYGVWRLPESLPAEKRSTEPFSRVFANYAELFGNKQVMGFALTSSFYYCSFYAFIAGTPFAYIDYYHVSPQVYGLLFGVNVIGIMSTNFFNGRLIARFGSERLFHFGALTAALAGTVLGIDAWFGWGGLAGLVIPFFIFAAMNGFIVANAVAGALAATPTNAGACSSLVGAMQYGSGILSASLVGWFADGTPWPMGAIIALMAILCAVAAMRMKRKTSQNGLDQ
ncbi:Bcr/CflA family multidrug efflux MFS transporter [Rouxiella chamberiensis]|uniref:Bcr/CflA family efflux transporter n=1 Tax=Rouxiella chamberiensis TaxID=1513468 RepID=A0ABY7HQH1_9GAMM|nr:Bcr/CflA family multidrug efflux MFS transporter [Rouxiella chamberiensis]WAT01106.1 Bcr/CflA family multidrug efflux MFS transporter [Rouxiella chamberiensis]